MIQLRLFGTLELSASDGRDLTALARRSKRTALLLYLAAAVPRGLHRRDTLLALFWPELDEANARSALSQALYVLRNALGEQAIVTRGDDEVGIAREVVWCDVQVFEAELDAGHFAEALALYRGELLNGFSLGDAPEYGRWVDQERARLQHRAAEAGWAWAESRAASGDGVQATHWARWAAALVPADEAVILSTCNRVEIYAAARLAGGRIPPDDRSLCRSGHELLPCIGAGPPRGDRMFDGRAHGPPPRGEVWEGIASGHRS